MRTYEQLIHLRIVHVMIIFATGIFVYQFSQWDDGLWIPISVLAIIGPFSPGLSIHKARQRLTGTLAGLIFSVIVWSIIHFFPNSLVFIALILVYCVAFAALQEYTYFIFIVSVMLYVNFDYMNLFFNHEVEFIANRGICVLVAICLCQFYEYFVFKKFYTNSTALVNTPKLDILLTQIDEQIAQMQAGAYISLAKLNQLIQDLIKNLDELAMIKESCQSGYSNQSLTLQLLAEYETKMTTRYQWLQANGYNYLTIL